MSRESKIIKERLEEQKKVIEEASRIVNELKKVLGKVTVVLYGSYVRGDFNLWSDIDIIIISERFNSIPPLERYDLVMRLLPARYEPKLWTVEEAKKQLGKPWWREALKHSIVLADDYGLMSG
ncbi:MAG: nucleotidyltransferase domain-containing protein [Crenarchaeota archaeon]|nr:nucleotidyltransferase domain-containing protein [Thermoproteota archaeon]